MTEPKKRGRPAKPKAERAPTVNFTMRMRPQLLEELRKSAEMEDRTISAEAERRLSQPKVNEVGLFISKAIVAMEFRTGKRWDEDEDSRAFCWAAADTALKILLGPPPGEEGFLSQLSVLLGGSSLKTDAERQEEQKAHCERKRIALETIHRLQQEEAK